MKQNQILIYLILLSFLSFGTSSINISPKHQKVCTTGTDSVTFKLNVSSIPNNSEIVIYKNTTNNFNPYNQEGDSIGVIKINAGNTSNFLSNSCPTILGIFIDACNSGGLKEQDNEYMIITSGSGFKVSNLGVDLPNSSNGNDQDINLGSNPCKFNTTFDATYLNTLRTGFCNNSNLNFAKPGDSIPPGAIVLIFTGNGTSFPYNFSGFCQLGAPIYILQSTCYRNTGAFVNNDAVGTSCGTYGSSRYRLTRILNKNCIDSLTYDRCGLPVSGSGDGDGNYVIRQQNKKDTASVANGGIQNNAADKCNGVVADSLNTGYSFTYHIPNNLCNDTIYVKAVAKPESITGQVSSEEVSFYLACVDVATNTKREEICSGNSTNINISSSDANANLSWTISGGTNISGANIGNGTNIIQQLSLLNNIAIDSIIYHITADDQGCSKSMDVKVVVIAAPLKPNLGNDTVYCSSFSQKLDAGSLADWTFNNQLVATNQSTFNATQAGTYTATVTNQCDSKSDTIIITQENVTVQIQTTATEICQGSTIDLSVQGQYDSIRWSTGASTNQITVSKKNSFDVIVYRNGCFAQATINITECQSGGVCNPKITGKNELCQGTSTTLDAGAGFNSYQWSTGEQTQVIQVIQGGKYIVNVTGSNNCTGKDSMEVKIITAPSFFSIGNDTTYCGNFSRVLSTNNPNTVWSTNTTNASIVITKAGTYTATISNQCGKEIASIKVDQHSLPTISLGADTVFCDDPIVLSVGQNNYASIVWNTQETGNSITVNSAGIYWVKVTDFNDCLNTDSIIVDLNCKNEIWAPNAFTPNNDGQNDWFYIRGNPQTTVIEDMQIVDRWGNIVFKAKNILPEDPTKGWDGTYKGKKQQLDIYGYYVKVKYKDGKTDILKGSLMLLE